MWETEKEGEKMRKTRKQREEVNKGSPKERRKETRVRKRGYRTKPLSSVLNSADFLFMGKTAKA
jgi:hypothetical protein